MGPHQDRDKGEEVRGMIFDGDFPTGKGCKYHCSPTCHPGQIDENEWHYGCLHKAWPQNRMGDFCPFVKCDGETGKCEIPIKRLKNMIGGKKRSITFAYKKVLVTETELRELEDLMRRRFTDPTTFPPHDNDGQTV
jgi:hypothetical protein